MSPLPDIVLMDAVGDFFTSQIHLPDATTLFPVSCGGGTATSSGANTFAVPIGFKTTMLMAGLVVSSFQPPQGRVRPNPPPAETAFFDQTIRRLIYFHVAANAWLDVMTNQPV